MTALMLTPEEVERLTGRKRVQAQVRVLKRLGITCRVNDADEVIVARSLAAKYLGVTPEPAAREPDLGWKAMRSLGIIGREKGAA